MFSSLIKRLHDFTRAIPAAQVTFVFNGWIDKEIERKFRGSVDYLDEEIRAKRMHPLHANGILEITTEAVDWQTQIGEKINVLFYPEHISVDQVQTYLRQIGIDAVPVQK